MSTAPKQAAIPHNAYVANIRRMQAMITKVAQGTGLDRYDVLTLVKNEISARTGGSRSTKDLLPIGWAGVFRFLQDILDRVNGKPIKKQPSFRPGRNSQALPTAAQRRVIDTLRELMGWSKMDLVMFCWKYFKFEKATTRARTNQVIDALKPQALRKHQISDRIDRALQLDLDPPDHKILADVAGQFKSGKQGSKVKIGSIPVVIKILNRYGVGIE